MDRTDGLLNQVGSALLFHEETLPAGRAGIRRSNPRGLVCGRGQRRA